MTETMSTAGDTLTRLGPEGVLALVGSLPEWRHDLDDDPAWVHDVQTVGLDIDLNPLALSRASLDAITERGRYPELVAVERITTASQRFIRLDAVAHYLRHPGELFDREGWYGQDHPVLFRQTDGTYRILDGTNRTAAARIRADRRLLAYVLDGADLSV